MTVVAFTALGKPVGKGSKRAFTVTRSGGSRSETVVVEPPHVKAFEDTIRSAAVEAMAQLDLQGLLDEPVMVMLVFRFNRPAGHYRTGRHAGELRDSAPGDHAVKPDVDKAARTVLDALTGTVIRDDSRVAVLHAIKSYADPPRLPEGVEVEVSTL